MLKAPVLTIHDRHQDNRVSDLNKEYFGVDLEIGKLYTVYSQPGQMKWTMFRPYHTRTLITSIVDVVMGAPLLLLCWRDIGTSEVDPYGRMPEFLYNSERIWCDWYDANEFGFFIPLEVYHKHVKQEMETLL